MLLLLLLLLNRFWNVLDGYSVFQQCFRLLLIGDNMIRKMILGATVGVVLGRMFLLLMPNYKILTNLFGVNKNFFLMMIFILLFIILFSVTYNPRKR